MDSEYQAGYKRKYAVAFFFISGLPKNPPRYQKDKDTVYNMKDDIEEMPAPGLKPEKEVLKGIYCKKERTVIIGYRVFCLKRMDIRGEYIKEITETANKRVFFYKEMIIDYKAVIGRIQECEESSYGYDYYEYPLIKDRRMQSVQPFPQ